MLAEISDQRIHPNTLDRPAYVAVYSATGNVAASAIFGQRGTIVVSPEVSKKVGNLDWKLVDTSRTLTKGPHAGTHYVTGFTMQRGQFTYYGYARRANTGAARAAALNVLEAAE